VADDNENDDDTKLNQWKLESMSVVFEPNVFAAAMISFVNGHGKYYK